MNENRKAAAGAAMPIRGIHILKVSVTVAADATIRNNRTSANDPPSSVTGEISNVMPRDRQAAKKSASMPGITCVM